MALKRNLIKKWKLYCIIDSSVIKGRDPLKMVNYLSKSGVKAVQLRYKHVPTYKIVRLAKKITRNAKRRDKIALIINDRPDAALASCASGVHLGEGDMSVQTAKALLGPGFMVGKTVHSIKEAKMAKREKPDYIGVGPVFSTPLKKNLRAKGVAFVRKAKLVSGLPTLAIGGINKQNCRKLRESSADGVCVTRAVFRAREVVMELKK